MTSGFESAINEMMAQIDQQRQGMVRLQQNLAEASGTATSPRRQVSVTVDSRGDIAELKFHGHSYRTMSGNELANLIVETFREAHRDMRARLWEQVGEIGPPGVDLRGLSSGEIDWSSAFNDAMTVPQPLIDLLNTPPTDLLDGLDIDRLDISLASPRADDEDPAHRKD